MAASADPLANITTGYPKLAARIEIQPQLSIYRRFGALNAQNILYLQAQLIDLETKLRTQQSRDDTNPQGKKALYAKTWYRLENSASDGDTKQLDLVLKTRQVLSEFNPTWFLIRIATDHAIIQQSMILKLPDPNATDLHYLQNYLETDSMGPLALLGRDASTWGSMLERDAHAPDLVALKVRAEKDALSTWAAKKVVGRLFTCCFKRFVKPSPGHGLVGVEDTLVYRATYGFTSLVASMVPIASIVVLYYVDSMPARLATIAVFNLFISICLMGLAKAKRAEIFAISAAFAAVQVVFIGTDKSSSNSAR
ncbi:hypothetical protein IQ06DRAFT_357127 [Phaeosphaeriaceae sp. SRC1lsM3a]|nr:hypothetical protein IQ06DRAFT_357127 [Stagonospora sp. SRC1lsM3a]